MQTSSLQMVRLPTIVVAVCLFPAMASAQTVVNDNWLGGTGDWSNPAMWSAGVVPNNSSDGTTVYNVTIDSGETDQVGLESESVTINSLTIGGTKGAPTSTLEWLNVYGFLTVTGNLTVNKKGKVIVSAYNTYNDACGLTVDGNTNVIGALAAKEAGNPCLGTVDNSGTISLTSSEKTYWSTLIATSIVNSGAIGLGNQTTAQAPFGPIPITQTKGKITVDVLGQLGANITASGGTITGSGQISGYVSLTGDAAITPETAQTYVQDCGKCWYELSIQNGYSQGGTSELIVNINASTVSPGLNVDGGSASVSGTLTVTLHNGNVPPVGYSLKILTCGGGITGSFTNLNLPALPDGETWSVTYNPADIVLTVTPASGS